MRRVAIMGAIAAFGAGLALAPGAGARAPAVDAALKAADAPAGQLANTATTTLSGGTVVNRFRQEVGGVPVAGAGAVVIDSPGAAPELLFDKTRTGVDAPGEPAISRDTAIGVAVATVAGQRIRGRPGAAQVIVPGDGGTLAWEVNVITSRPADWVIRVDAASGEVISRLNQIRQAMGESKLFVPNAVVANDGYQGLKDHRDRNSSKLTRLREPVTLANLDDGQTCLTGDWVNVKRSSQGKTVCKDSLDWTRVKRANDRFEALMSYFHIDETQEYIQTLELAAPINAESQKVVVNSFSDDNSFYSPGGDRIETGTGGVDDGEDADVVVHEYGHAVQDAQNPQAFAASTGFDEHGAQGEGFGDYLAQAYSTETVGFDEKWSHCVMEWDATSYDNHSSPPPGICLRRTDNENTLSEQTLKCNGTEVHCIGKTWASALSDLRADLGDDGSSRSIMDRVVLASHELLPPVPTFSEASTALLEADEDLYPDGPDDGHGDHCAEIGAETAARQLLLTNPC